MCSIDLEPCSLWVQSAHTARKPKPCAICEWEIPAGAPYQKYAWKFDGSFNTAVICLGCELLLREFGLDHGQTPTPDYFEEALQECWDGAEKTDPEVKTWRNASAEILKRRRLADRAEVAAHG